MGREPRAVRRWEKLIFYSARMTRTMTRFAQRQSTAAKEMQLLFPSTISADFQILDSLNSNSSHLPSTGEVFGHAKEEIQNQRVTLGIR